MDSRHGDSYQAPPARVGAGAAARGAAAAVILGGLVALAVLKPWGGGSPAAPGGGPGGREPGASRSVALVAGPSQSAASPGAVAGPASSPSSAPAGGTAGRASEGGDPLFGPLVARLAAWSGEWGIGSGGWGISPVSGSPWTGWERVEPRTLRPAARPPRPPSCEDLPWLRVGIVVAVTVPPDLPPDWAVAVLRVDASGAPSPVPGVTQVSPPGNRGVTYLVGADAAQWRSGAYRFALRTASSAIVLDACLVAL